MKKIKEYIFNIKSRALQIVKTLEISDLRRVSDIENVDLVKYILKIYLNI